MIDVCWHFVPSPDSHARGNTGNFGMLNEMFDLYDCRHWSGFKNIPAGVDGGVMVIHGGNERTNDIALNINEEVRNWKWCLFIVTGDEDTGFPTKHLSHPNSLIWLQVARPGASADRNFIYGYMPQTKGILAKYKDQLKDLNWFFAGQITNSRRYELKPVLESLSGGVFVPTKGFFQGLGQEEYLRQTARAKVIPCPGGIETPDSFRMAEALEAGAIPVLDEFSVRRFRSYWPLVFSSHPFRVVEDWQQFPEILNEILSDYENNQKRALEFWAEYKKTFNGWLEHDLTTLGATA